MGLEKLAINLAKCATTTTRTCSKASIATKNITSIFSGTAKSVGDEVLISRAVAFDIYSAPSLKQVGIKNWFLNFFKKSPKKFITQTSELLQAETKQFYNQTRTVSEIAEFEENKALIEYLLNQPLCFWKRHNQEYTGLINLIKTNGLNNRFAPKEFSSFETKCIYDEMRRNVKYSFEEAKKLYFKQNGIINPNLAEIKAKIAPRKVELGPYADFIKENSEYKPYALDEIRTILDDSRKISLESGSLLKEYKKGDIYDLPLRFASASYNSLAKNGSAYIETEIPKIFKGLNKKEIYENIDLLSTHLRRNFNNSFPQGSVVNFKIAEKDFTCTALKHGMEGTVFRITSGNEQPIILKVFYADCDVSRRCGVTFAPLGLYGSMGILREANFAKVTDVPALYMANPIYKPIAKAESRYMGGWQIVEDATQKEAKDGLKFMDWLKQKGLRWDDNKPDAWINGICVDTGAIRTPHRIDVFGNRPLGDWGINSVYAKYLNGETTEKILASLK